MSADEVLRIIPSQGGGAEARFAVGKLSEMSVIERHNLAKLIVKNGLRPHVNTQQQDQKPC